MHMAKTLKILKRLDRETAAEVYYAGTFVRDIIRRKSPKSVEIVIRNLQLGHLLNYFKKHGTISRIEGKGHFLFQPENIATKIKITLPKKNSGYNPYFTLYNDASSRDFTINAMFLPITSKVRRNIIDFFGGLNDIRSRKIRTTRSARQSIRRNPILILKAVSLSAEINYKIDSNLFYAIKSNCALIFKLLRVQIKDELVKILLSSKPSRYLKLLYNLNLLNEILPELVICKGVMQNTKYHKFDVFTHCIYACDNAEPDLTLRLAALFHDVGKPQAREEVANKITFYNHESMSANLTKRLLRRLKFNSEIVTRVTDLIYIHMYNYEPNEWTDAAVKRFIRKAKISDQDLDNLGKLPIFLLRRADRLANGYSLKAISYRQKLFEERIKKICIRSRALDISDLAIDGNVIINKFNLKAGPTVGHILNYLLSIVIEDQGINTEEALIEAASNYLSKALK